MADIKGRGPIIHDVSTMTMLAARAKAKVKAQARGWTMVTADEIIAMAFIVDLMLEDAALPTPLEPAREPDPISTL